MGLLGLQHSTVDSFVLEVPMGIVLKEEQEMNPERDSKKKDPLAKRDSFHLRLMGRNMPSS